MFKEFLIALLLGIIITLITIGFLFTILSGFPKKDELKLILILLILAGLSAGFIRVL